MRTLGGGDHRRIRLRHTFDEIISVENLLAAWSEFARGKRSKSDVQLFKRNLMENILALHEELRSKTYRHGGYYHFRISDPKPRDIHKASVRDRLLHHAIHRILYPFFDRTFIADSFSCRIEKGTHKAMDRFRKMARKVSRNHRRTCWVLKLDVRKFFASIDHSVLKSHLARSIDDADALWLLGQIIDSFATKPDVGLPLGNLTSQVLVNIYMNAFDQFVKHRLKAKYYIRYADDFVILSEDRSWLQSILPRISGFLREHLCLELHPNKIFLQSFTSGVDYLGWVHFPQHRVLRTKTKQRMMRRVFEHPSTKTIQSYLGLLRHGQTIRLRKEIEDIYWLISNC